MDKPMVKAWCVTSSREFVVKRFGAEIWQKVIDSLSDSDKAEVDKEILSTSWFPEETYRNIFLAIDKFVPSPEETLYQLGLYQAKQSVSKYYMPLIKFLNVNFMLKFSAIMWGLVHTHGKLEVVKESDTSAFLYIKDFPTQSKPFCNGMRGYFHGVAEMTGFKIVEITELECVSQGASYCTFHGVWK